MGMQPCASDPSLRKKIITIYGHNWLE